MANEEAIANVLALIIYFFLKLFLVSFILTHVWDAIVAGMFEGPEITFWAMCGLVFALQFVAKLVRGGKTTVA